MASNPPIHYFGIRHHGPGSARSVLRALESLEPDCLLVEGPPEADAVLPLLTHETMEPPVALLVYNPDKPRSASFYPFAVFSPEWQALRFALSRHIPAHFIDLPQAHHLALDEQEAQEDQPAATSPPRPHEPTDQSQNIAPAPTVAAVPDPDTDIDTQSGRQGESGGEADAGEGDTLDDFAELPFDPLGWLGRAAGYADGEEWWEQMVERRRDSTDLFAAIRDAMATVRKDAPPRRNPRREHREALREAYMRKRIRDAQKEGFQRIAVVCGAWHVPALVDPPPARADNDLLKGLPKTKVSATWAPWTYGRLCMATGYGAGIESPGWYEHLWNCERANGGKTSPDPTSRPDASYSRVAVEWLVRVARLLREEDYDVSSAHVIEAVRLADALAAVRNRPQPGLPEITESTRAIFCFGDDTPLALIHEKLIVGDRLGRVPEGTPILPIQLDLEREQKRLRLQPQAFEKALDLDLRKPNDLDRSRLLHRLLLLGIPWGRFVQVAGKKGSFHEVWSLQWQPEFAIVLIEKSVWGSTVEAAASRFASDQADRAEALPDLTPLVDRVLLADLPDAVRHVMARLEAVAALAGDVPQLMDALPPLTNVMRYGNVRQTDAAMVAHVVDGLTTRITIGLPGACASLDDDAAAAMFGRVMNVDGAVRLLQNHDYLEAWRATLRHLTAGDTLHGLIAGRACRLLLDGRAFSIGETARRMGLALSPAANPDRAGAWVDGFLRGSGMILLHDDDLWSVLDAWVSSLSSDAFTRLLPLLRRTFSTFPAPERRQMGERVQRGAPKSRPIMAAGEEDPDLFHRERADAVLPLLARLIGVDPASLAAAPTLTEEARS